MSSRIPPSPPRPAGQTGPGAPQVSLSPRIRRSPYYEATVRHGATQFSVYNGMYLPMGENGNILGLLRGTHNVSRFMMGMST